MQQTDATPRYDPASPALPGVEVIRGRHVLRRWAARALGFAFALALLLGVFLRVVAPWYQHWGAQGDEAVRALPGDEFVRAREQSTRAITIAAPAGTVWSWIAQLGQERAGFYSYELLEDLVGCEMSHLERIDPQLAYRRVGEKLWMYPPDKLGGVGHAELLRIDPGHALVFGTWQAGSQVDRPHDGTWSFIVEELGPERARLLVRGRMGAERSWAGRAFDQLVFGPVHFMMERRMMTNVRVLAEGGSPWMRAFDTLDVVCFAVSFGLMITAAVFTFRRQAWWRPLAVFVLAAAVFQVLTLGQPGFELNVLPLGFVACALWWSRRPIRAAASAGQLP